MKNAKEKTGCLFVFFLFCFVFLAKNTMRASPSFGLQFTISFYPHFVQNPDSCIGSQPLKPNVYKITEMKKLSFMSTAF